MPQKVKDFWDYGENPEVYPIDTGRLRNVVELVTEKAGWGKRDVPKGHGLGLAVHRSFVSYVAAVIEAAVDEKGNITIPRVDIAVDCGPIVNPDRVRSQFEGAVVMGLGVGLLNEISFKDGRVQQSNLDDYQVLRISDAPRETHVYIVPHGYDMHLGGVGEPGVPPVAPALMNAIFAASGKRIRSLPLGRAVVRQGLSVAPRGGPELASGPPLHRLCIRRRGEVSARRPTPRRRLRPKLERGRDPKRNENEQHDRLDDRERRLGPSRRERVKGRNLQETLRDKHEHIEIKRRNRAGDKDPSPRSGETEAVIGGDGADKQNERQHAHRARRVEAERRQRETGQAGQDRRDKEDGDRRLEIPIRAKGRTTSQSRKEYY